MLYSCYLIYFYTINYSIKYILFQLIINFNKKKLLIYKQPNHYLKCFLYFLYNNILFFDFIKEYLILYLIYDYKITNKILFE